MKKMKIAVVSAVSAALIFASSCTQDGDKYYLLNNSTVVASSEEEDMEQVFRIADFNKVDAKIYLESLSEPVKDGSGNVVPETIYLPVDASTQQAVEDVPYIDFKEFHQMFKYLIEELYYADLEGKITGSGKIRFENPDNKGYYVEFDAGNQTIYFNDYDAFKKNSRKATILDMVGNRQYLTRSDKKFERYGKAITVNLKKYGIPMKIIGDTVYIPLQVYNDIFNGGIPSFVYTKGDLYFAPVINSEYYDADSGKDTRSDVLKALNYSALCLNLDFNYGLKESHGITTFAKLFKETGLIQYLSAYSSALDFVRGIDELCCNYFADFHSGLNKPSYYAGKSYTRPADLVVNPIFINQRKLMSSYKSIREGVFTAKSYDMHYTTGGDDAGYYDYSKFGDTAYITYDHFTTPKKDYYALTSNGTVELAEDDVEDTFGLVIYAQQEIKKDTDIKNVVIDLSNNGGGAVDALAYISAWFLGESTINIKSSLTGAMSSTTYLIDTNLDGNYDVSDTLQGLKNSDESDRSINLYCITSPMSFSCGNALPAIFKDSGKVVMLGKKSGGGACVVCNGSSADGTVFQKSGCYQMCTTKNGSFYQADEGIEPDFIFADFSNIYDREDLTMTINSYK